MNEIQTDEAYEKFKNNKLMIVDVREPDEWKVGHIDGALSNPLTSFNINTLPKDMPIAFICRSGGRSGMATKKVLDSRNDVFNIIGGMKKWKKNKLPMVCDAPDKKPTVK